MMNGRKIFKTRNTEGGVHMVSVCRLEPRKREGGEV